jgi:tetratricopeptide (TPR) repeat protein
MLHERGVTLHTRCRVTDLGFTPGVRSGTVDTRPLGLDQPVRAVEGDTPVVADDPAAVVGVGQPGDDADLACGAHGGRVGVEDTVVVGLAVGPEDLGHQRVGLIAVRLQTVLHHPQTAVGHDRPLHGGVRLETDDQLAVPVDAAEQTAARQRLLEHLLHSAHRADGLLAPHRERITLAPPVAGADPVAFTGREEAANWLETERAVILAAVRDDRTRTHCASQCWQLAITVELHLDRHGRWQEQLALQSAALDAAQRAADLSGRAHAHRALGFVHGRLENPAEAVRHLESALEVFAAAGDSAGRARTHRYLAFQANKGDRHDEALTHCAAAHALYREAGHLVGQTQVSNEVGWTHILRGDHAQAILDCQVAIGLHQHLDDQNGEAAAWDSLGYAHHHLGRHREAIGCYQRALLLYRRVHDTYLEADTLVHIGDSLEALGDMAGADASWRQSLEILENIAHPEAETLRKRLVQNAG